MTMIMDILVACANSLPNDSEASKSLRDESKLVRQAFETNNSDMLKACISSQKHYANEVKVTIY